MLRAFISKIWKVVNWPFLRTLPVTVLPLFTAITAGILLSLWNHALVDTNLLTQLIAVEFLGKPLRGDEILGQMGNDFTGQPANTLEGLLGGFGAAADDMFAHIDKWSSESVRQSVSGTAGSAITTSTTSMAAAMT